MQSHTKPNPTWVPRQNLGNYKTCDISEDLLLLIPNAVARESKAAEKLDLCAPDIDGSLSDAELQELLDTFNG